MRRRKTAVYQISDAPKRLTDDVARRQRNYMISMGVRVLLFLGAVLIPVAMPFRLLLMLGALVIPYVAVIYANGGREPESHSDAFYQPPGPQELDATNVSLGAPGASWRSDGREDARGPAAGPDPAGGGAE